MENKNRLSQHVIAYIDMLGVKHAVNQPTSSIELLELLSYIPSLCGNYVKTNITARGRQGGRKKIEATNPKVMMAKNMHKDHGMSIDDI